MLRTIFFWITIVAISVHAQITPPPSGGGSGVQSLTTTGTSGASTLTGTVLNVPQYAGGYTGCTTDGSNGVVCTGNISGATMIPTTPYKYLYVGWPGTSTYKTAGSNDGLNWTDTGGVLTGGNQSNINAPLAAWYNNQWVLTLWAGGAPWQIYTGKNGKDFSYVATVTWTSGQLGYTPDACYAQTIFVDVDNTLHLFVPCSPNGLASGNGFQVYETHPTNTALTTWSDPLLINTGGSNSVYDFQVYNMNGQYWAAYYDHAGGQYFHVSNSLYGPYVTPPGGSVNLGIGEGPQVFRIGDHLRLFGDTASGMDYKDCYDYYPAALPTTQVVAEYDFVQGASATTLYDRSGNGLDGTLSATAPTWQTGGGLLFNGSSSYVDLGNPAALNITNNLWAVVAYYKAGGDTGTLLGKNDGSTNAGSAYQIQAGSAGSPGSFAFNVFSGSSKYSPASPTIANGSWAIVEGTLNSTTADLATFLSSSGTIASTTATTSALNTISTHAVIGADGSMSSGFFASQIAYVIILHGQPTEYERIQAYNYVQQKLVARNAVIGSFAAAVNNSNNPSSCTWTRATPWAYGAGSTWPFVAKHGSITLNPMWVSADYSAPKNPTVPATIPPNTYLTTVQPTATGPAIINGLPTGSATTLKVFHDYTVSQPAQCWWQSTGAQANKGLCVNLYGQLVYDFVGVNFHVGTATNYLDFGSTSITSQLSIGTPQQLFSTIATGTAPLIITSTTPVANLVVQKHAQMTTCATTTTCANTAQLSPRIVHGNVTLSGGSAVVASITAWTATTSYDCTGTDKTALNPVQIVNTSTTSITITGTGTDVIGYTCVGN